MTAKKHIGMFSAVLVNLICVFSSALGGDGDFVKAKTIFQTNTAYDSRLSIAVDGVVVHRHGTNFAPAMKSWRDNGFTVGRMFFADSDAANAYWTGKWDGTEHREDVERDRSGKVVKCANVRPYMLPTDGWIRYLEEMTDKSLTAGALAILPEEPLAHVFTGYEESFREIWADRYKRPWEPQHTSAEARFLTAQLKNELYIELERRLSKRTVESAKAGQRDVGHHGRPDRGGVPETAGSLGEPGPAGRGLHRLVQPVHGRRREPRGGPGPG